VSGNRTREEKGSALIDQMKMISRAQALFEPLRTTPRYSQIIDVVLEHMIAENVELDIDRTMGTMIPEPRHEYFGCPGMETIPLVGFEAVRNYYLRTFALGPGRAEMEIMRVGIGNDAIFKEGNVLYSGMAARTKFPEFARQLDPDRPCIVRKRHLMVMSMEGEKIASELHYLDGPYTLDDVEYLE
jgi:hypothetical protein